MACWTTPPLTRYAQPQRSSGFPEDRLIPASRPSPTLFPQSVPPPILPAICTVSSFSDFTPPHWGLLSSANSEALLLLIFCHSWIFNYMYAFSATWFHVYLTRRLKALRAWTVTAFRLPLSSQQVAHSLAPAAPLPGTVLPWHPPASLAYFLYIPAQTFSCHTDVPWLSFSK